jgi:predicted glutamine amidotransferase
MCRLFGLSGAPERVAATFWLLESPDSLLAQSRREPDGTGLGTFDVHGRPHIEKQPLAAFRDRAFAHEAREERSMTFVGHVRFASTGGLTRLNTHPFEMRDRLLAHNGVIEGIDDLDQRLGRDRQLVQGETDSERFFALITVEIERLGGDVGAGIASASSWVAENLPLLSLNLVLTTATELWALRYPDAHELHVLERPAPTERSAERGLDQSSSLGLRVHSAELGDRPSVVVASERMDDDPGWRLMDCGELLHVDGEGQVASVHALKRRPAHPLTLADLEGRAASSQAGSHR